MPVFRYAFEHWEGDSYEAVVFHRGPLSEADLSRVDALGGGGLGDRRPANIVIRTIDLDQDPEPRVLDFWRQLDAATLPWVVLRYPIASGLPGNIVSQPLTSPTIPLISTSPVREEIVRRLGRGETAVWVLLESGDAEKDDSAGRFLRDRLKYLESVLQLPTLDAQDIANGLISVGQDDLRIQFSVLRLVRQDPEEEVFVSMLLGTEADLRDFDEPIVFPVFGRGRALYALIGKGISAAMVDEAASFLIGSCSCQVKEQNPGVDLLMAADWDTLLQTQATSAGENGPPSPSADSAPVTVTISGDDMSESIPSSRASSERYSPLVLGVLGGLTIAGLAAVGFLFWGRRS